LNHQASQALLALGELVHAVTDITGFGLCGHTWEMATQSLTSMRISFAALPLLPSLRHYAQQGCITGGAWRNQEFISTHVLIADQLDPFDREILWDPQTSGGLLAAVAPEAWPELSRQVSETL